MQRAVALLSLFALLAGCAGSTSETPTGIRTTQPPPPVEPWTPLACDSSGATTTAIDAQLAPGLQGIASSIASSMAAAMGDRLTGPASRFEDSPNLFWPTARGRIFIQMTNLVPEGASSPEIEGPFVGALYELNGTVSATQAATFAKALGVYRDTLLPATGDEKGGALRQQWDGRELIWQSVGVAGLSWTNGAPTRLNIGGLYTFQADRAQVALPAATETATQFMRCTLDAAGKTAAKGYELGEGKVAGVAVIGQTLTHLVHVRYDTPDKSPCGTWDSRWVYVDAWTGAVKGSQLAPCI